MIWRNPHRGVLACFMGMWLLQGMACEAWAQKRVFAKVEPNVDSEQKLSFDVNASADDNVAPNIFVTGDGKRGFVSYTGSGIVMVFSPVTGEILGKIATGGRPAFSAPLPDQKTLAVVSALDDKVFIIDTETSELVATYTFSKALFGFGSIVTVSPDGLAGYISSTGTGEVIKFSTLDGSESALLKDFEAPAQ